MLLDNLIKSQLIETFIFIPFKNPGENLLHSFRYPSLLAYAWNKRRTAKGIFVGFVSGKL
jgi:hypothetical protein